MSAPSTAVDRGLGFLQFGLFQARIELTIRLGRPGALSLLVSPILVIGVLTLMGPGLFDDTSSAPQILAGLAAASLFIGGIVGVSTELVAEQEDGTMLRVRTLPHGLAGFLVGKVISFSAISLLSMMLLLVPAHFLLGPILPVSAAGWLGLLGVAILSLAATVPLGAVAGAVAKTTMAVLPLALVSYGLMVISGIFFPISLMPPWVGAIAQIFPMYWLGLGSRAVLIPDSGFSDVWQAGLAIGVPLAWAALGLILAPKALRRMTARQSGARLEAVQARRVSRGY